MGESLSEEQELTPKEALASAVSEFIDLTPPKTAVTSDVSMIRRNVDGRAWRAFWVLPKQTGRIMIGYDNNETLFGLANHVHGAVWKDSDSGFEKMPDDSDEIDETRLRLSKVLSAMVAPEEDKTEEHPKRSIRIPGLNRIIR